MNLCFMGLGTMGKPMALNMAKREDALMVFDILDKAFDDFSGIKAKTTTSLPEAAKNDIVFLCLPNSSVVEKVCFGEKGLIAMMQKGAVLVDFSTIKHSTALETARKCETAGIRYMDAPVSGMEARAKDGTLTVMCGGSKELFDELYTYFESIGNNIVYMGANGSGQLAKLINQLLFDINVAALAEILPMAVHMGLDPEKIGNIINSGTGRSYASEFFIPRALDGDFSEGYALQNAYKDLVSAAELGAEEVIALPILGAATTTYQMALRKGYAKENKSAMMKVYEELLGVQFRKKA